MSKKRRLVSWANRIEPPRRARAGREASVRPRSRTVSIIPGIDTAAPDRTETNKRDWCEPKRGGGPTGSASASADSMAEMPSMISAQTSSGTAPPASRKSLHTVVATVKPGGTFTPMLAISQSPAPFPPSRSFMPMEPSEAPCGLGLGATSKVSRVRGVGWQRHDKVAVGLLPRNRTTTNNNGAAARQGRRQPVPPKSNNNGRRARECNLIRYILFFFPVSRNRETASTLFTAREP